MKRAQHLSTINKKLTSVPELPYRKGLLNSSPKPKEKSNAKPQYDKIEPMVLRSPPTGESIVRYALPIPSSKTKDLIAEDEMVRRITKHLKMVVTALEDTYGTVDEDGERTLKKPKDEGVSLSVGDDMNAFLLCCSQFAAQMEEAVKEERNILESLFKWFQQQVNQMEEISKDQSILEADLPSDDKTLNLNIAQIANLVHRFEDLKTRLKGHKGSLVFKLMERDTLPDSMKSYEAIEHQIEEFIKSHSAYESQVASETEPEAPYSVTKRMNVMIKIFENQTNMLERALNEQSIIETKYKQMETDFQVLLLEKTLLESEIQRIRESEKAKQSSKEDRTKKPTKPEKKKEKDSERKLSPSRELELAQIQKEAEELKMEKKALQEQLKWALQEAERNKNQLEYVLHHEMEMLKEERSKTKVERGFSKSKGMHEDSKYSLSMETDAQLGGQQQNYDQVPPEKSKRGRPWLEYVLKTEPRKVTLKRISLEKTPSSAPVVDPLAGSDGVPGVPALPPEIFKSFTAMPLIEEHLESASPQPKETEMWSLVSFPPLTEEMEKAETSEHILSHTEAEKAEVSYNMPNEIPAPEDKDLLLEAQVATVKQLYSQGRCKQEYEEQDKKLGREDSVTNIKLKEQKGSKTGRLYTHEEESDRMVYEESAKAKVPAKKPDASKGKGLTPPEADDRALSPESQGSVSKADVQTKKQRIHKREKLPVSHEVPDRSFEHQDSELKFEIQAKKLKIFKPESVHSEVSDKNIRLEDQKAQSSSQVQLKKQKSLGGEIFTIHFAVPDDISAHLHQESSLEFQAQAERGTSEDARFSSIPVEYQKKDVSVDNLLPEKKLLITRSQSQNKKYASSQEGSAENENVDRFFTNEDLELQSMDQIIQKGRERRMPRSLQASKSDAHRDEQESPCPASDKVEAESKSTIDVQETYEPLKTLNPMISEIIFRLDMDRVLENDLQNLKETFEQHLLRSEVKAHSRTRLGVSSMKTKPQENVNAKYHPPKTFPTKVINLLPFTSQEANMENSTPYETVIPKPFYRTSRGSSGIPTTFQQLLNRKTAEPSKTSNLEKHIIKGTSALHKSASASKKHVPKGLSKPTNIGDKGAQPPSSLHTSTSTTKKNVLKEQPKPTTLDKKGVDRPNNLVPSTSASSNGGLKGQPKSENSNEKGLKLPDNPRPSASATRKHLIKELSTIP